MVDRWFTHKILKDTHGVPILDKDGHEQKAPTARNGKGMRWQARFVTRDGKEVGKSFAKKTDANRWLAEQTANVERGEHIPRDKLTVTVDAISVGWEARIEQLKPSTRAGYLNRWRTHVQPRWGTVKLSDVEHADVVRWIADLTRAGQSVSSVSACWGVLNQILKMAVRNGNILRNPCADVALPKTAHIEHEDLRIITINQLRRLAASAEEHGTPQDGTMILTLGFVGLRFGELAGLQVRDVNLDARTLRIRRNVTEVDGHLHIGSPKSGKPRRVNFPAYLVKRLQDQIGASGPDDYLFPLGGRNQTGASKPMRRTNWAKRVFTPAVEKVELKPLTIHDLRHAFAASAIQAGASIYVVQRQLGHARPSITLDIYGYLFEDDLSDAADRLDAALDKLDQNAKDRESE
ncbi:tyrosine-type recombinase/integrase [Rhodococcus erythropolis]|uniref:tyrosine-type recombinase/integrase n=1 Tax=Rhodococcus erythropolis TaxID=1833 RepID=UPI00294A8A01|nr:tyrosine-type recombinase/integrase [Rhodococcus erythropolis]MDV6211789.1 tyrosine-type recombinase/integrase [Rhodococcus erythropolis]